MFIESSVAFSDKWYGIIFNPFYITRKQLFAAVKKFAYLVSDNDKFLDVGCGTKPYRKLFKSGEYVGIDVRGGGLIDKTKIVDKFFDGVKIPYKSKSFDVVIATEVLEHAVFPEKLMAEMSRVLKPGGKLFITMPFVWPEHGLPFDFQRYTSFKHKKLTGQNGLKIVSVNRTTGVFGTCGQLLSDFYYNELSKLIFKSDLSYGTQFILFRICCFLLCFPTQLIFEIADIIFKRRGITLDFVVTAQKNEKQI